MDKPLTRLIDLDNKLKEIEQIQNLAIRAAEVGLWCWYPDDNSIYWSEFMFQLFDVTREEFTNNLDGFTCRIHPQDLPVVKSRLDLCRNDHIPYDCNYRIQKKDGEWAVIKGHGNIMIDTQGRECMAGVCIRLNNLATPSKLVDKDTILSPVPG